MEASEGTDHEDAETESTPDAGGTELGEDGANTGGSLVLVELGDDGVGRMRDDGAEDTSNVTRSGGDSKLFDLGALSARLGHDVLVDSLNSALESPELHHGVRNLATPERSETLVESTEAFLSNDLGHSFAKSSGEGAGLGVSGLDADLNGLPGAQSQIGDDLSGSGSREPQEILVVLSVLGSSSLHKGVLEDLIETELEETLERVSDQGGAPAEEHSANTILSSNLTDRSLDSDLYSKSVKI